MLSLSPARNENKLHKKHQWEKEEILGQGPLVRSLHDLPVAPQDEAGLTTTFQTWPRGWFHIPKDPDFPVPS